MEPSNGDGSPLFEELALMNETLAHHYVNITCD
jgi:hypothetical protein